MEDEDNNLAWKWKEELINTNRKPNKTFDSGASFAYALQFVIFAVVFFLYTKILSYAIQTIFELLTMLSNMLHP